MSSRYLRKKRHGLPTTIEIGHGVIQLRRELAQLKNQIRQNEQIWTGFRRIEIQSISAPSLPHLIGGLVTGIEREFPNVDCVTLACIDLEYEISRILGVDDDTGLLDNLLILLPREKLDRIFPDPTRPWLGPCTPEIQGLLFPGYNEPLKSVALAPLRLGEEFIGCLGQGSRNRNHFSSDTATELLEHLAAIVAMCLQNGVSSARLERDGLTDPLTGVANRRQLERRLVEEVERWIRYGHDLTCIMVDIDHFKNVNDQYGHSAGDRVLQGVAETLGQGLRSSDILSRYGGEEFVLVFPETPLREAASIAERLHQQLADQRFDIDQGTSIGITASIGVAGIDAEKQHSSKVLAASLLDKCDAALYQAKHGGRNRVVTTGLEH